MALRTRTERLYRTYLALLGAAAGFHRRRGVRRMGGRKLDRRDDARADDTWSPASPARRGWVRF